MTWPAAPRLIFRLSHLFFVLCVCQAMTPPEYGLEEFVEGVEALDKRDDIVKVRVEVTG